jgi:hypothetical protein
VGRKKFGFDRSIESPGHAERLSAAATIDILTAASCLGRLSVDPRFARSTLPCPCSRTGRIHGSAPDRNNRLLRGPLQRPVQSDKSLKWFHVYAFVGICAPDLLHFVDVVNVIHGLDIGRAYMTQT